MSKLHRISTLIGLVFSMLLVANVATGSDKGNEDQSSGPMRSGCLRFEGDEIGQANVSQTVSGVTITVFDWVEKADEPGSYVGFSFKASGGRVIFAVKCGQEVYRGKGRSWVNPNGRMGRFVTGISNIAFCVRPR